MLDGIFSKICLVMGIIMIFMGIEIYIQHLKIKNYEISQSAVKEIGNVQDANAKSKNKESKENKGEVENEYATIITGMHIDNERLRNQIASSRKLPRTPQICTSTTERTEVNWPVVEQAITEYRSEVAVLIGQCDQTTAALDVGKDWIIKETD